MNEEDVRKAVEEIRAKAYDDEAAHGREDELYEGLLYAIAYGICEDPVACAREALKTKEIKFARWCA